MRRIRDCVMGYGLGNPYLSASLHIPPKPVLRMSGCKSLFSFSFIFFCVIKCFLCRRQRSVVFAFWHKNSRKIMPFAAQINQFVLSLFPLCDSFLAVHSSYNQTKSNIKNKNKQK